MTDKDKLLAEAESLGLDLDKRYSEETIREKIDEARAAAPKAPKPAGKTMKLLMLRGYVPQNAHVLSVDEQTGKDSTLAKAVKGTIHEFSEEEGKALIRRGIAVRPDEATDNNLIQAGLKSPPQREDDEEF